MIYVYTVQFNNRLSITYFCYGFDYDIMHFTFGEFVWKFIGSLQCQLVNYPGGENLIILFTCLILADQRVWLQKEFYNKWNSKNHQILVIKFSVNYWSLKIEKLRGEKNTKHGWWFLKMKKPFWNKEKIS